MTTDLDALLREIPDISMTDLEADYVNQWFELTYASYLVLPRSLMQAMPTEWQKRMVSCLEEMREEFCIPDTKYTVLTRGGRKNQFFKDPLRDYRRPDQQAIAECQRYAKGKK